MERARSQRAVAAPCRILLAAAVAVVTFAAVTPNAVAAPITINFDAGVHNQLVGTDFAALGVTFSNARYHFTNALAGQSPPFTITAVGTSTFGPSNPIVAVFSADVDSVSVDGIDVGARGAIVSAYDAISGGSLVGSAFATGTGNGSGQFFTLTVGGSGIRRIELSQRVDADPIVEGMGFDNLTFEFSQVAVPEPTALALLGLSLVGFFAGRRATRRPSA